MIRASGNPHPARQDLRLPRNTNRYSRYRYWDCLSGSPQTSKVDIRPEWRSTIIGGGKLEFSGEEIVGLHEAENL